MESSRLIARVTNLSRYDFVHRTILIAATDTHYINFSAWDGNGQIMLEIDHGSDGTIDETIVLDNQLTRLFLPLLTK